MVRRILQRIDCLKNGAVACCALYCAGCLFLTGCGTVAFDKIAGRLIPSNERDWSPQFRALPRAVISGDQVALYNIRNNIYLSEKDFIIQHYDRVFELSDIQSVDFIVVPFQGMEAIAHTMLSFGLSDGTYIAVSVEVRTEKGESYNSALGLSNEFELIYVVADERDVIRLRTRHRNAEVYIYPSRATPEQAQRLFVDMMERANQLAEKPEFYDTLTNNCTNNLVRHVNRVFPNRVPRAWQVLLSGFSDRYAYDLGLLDQRISFEELRQLAHINDLAAEHYDAEDFSQKIRARLTRLKERMPDPAELGDGPAASASSTPAAANARPRLLRRWADRRGALPNRGRLGTSRSRRQSPGEQSEPLEVNIEE